MIQLHTILQLAPANNLKLKRIQKEHSDVLGNILGLLPSALLFIGGLETIKTATIMASFPILFIYVVMMISVIRMLKTT